MVTSRGLDDKAFARARLRTTWWPRCLHASGLTSSAQGLGTGPSCGAESKPTTAVPATTPGTAIAQKASQHIVETKELPWTRKLQPGPENRLPTQPW